MLKEKVVIASLLVLVLSADGTYAETIDMRLRIRNRISSDEKIITRANLMRIKQFILKQGYRETYCNMYNNNPAYRTKNFSFYLNPDSGQKNINCETDKSDFHSLTIRNPKRKNQYRRVEFLDKHYVYIVVSWPTKDLTVSQARAFVIEAIKEILTEIEKETPIRVTDSLLLQPPLTLVELYRWRDGGSLGFVVRDATDEQLLFCIDFKIGSDTVGRWYLHATHPTDEGAKLVEEESQTEQALKTVLRAWVSQHYDETERLKLAISELSDEIAENEMRFNAWTIMKLLSRKKAS